MQDGHRISLALFDKGKFFYKKEKHGNCTSQQKLDTEQQKIRFINVLD